jgi:hypothetical protein
MRLELKKKRGLLTNRVERVEKKHHSWSSMIGFGYIFENTSPVEERPDEFAPFLNYSWRQLSQRFANVAHSCPRFTFRFASFTRSVHVT